MKKRILKFSIRDLWMKRNRLWCAPLPSPFSNLLLNRNVFIPFFLYSSFKSSRAALGIKIFVILRVKFRLNILILNPYFVSLYENFTKFSEVNKHTKIYLNLSFLINHIRNVNDNRIKYLSFKGYATQTWELRFNKNQMNEV